MENLSKGFELVEGFTLPAPEEGSAGLDEHPARQYATQLAVVEKGADAFDAIDKQMATAKAGRAFTEREVQRSKDALIAGQNIISDLQFKLDKTGDAIDVLNSYEELNKKIQEEQLEEKVVNKFNGSDPATNEILNERMDAVEFDTLQYKNELAFNNINLEIQADGDHWADSLLDVEELGFAQIERVLTGTAARDLMEELKRDMGSMQTIDFRRKWREKFEDLKEEFFFDNPDHAIAVYGLLNAGSYDSALEHDIMEGLMGLLAPGTGLAVKMAKGLVKRGAMNTRVAKQTPVSLQASTEVAPSIPRGPEPKFSVIHQAIASTIKSRSYVGEMAARTGGSRHLADDVTSSILDDSFPAVYTPMEQVGWALMGQTPAEILTSVPMLVARSLSAGDRILANTTDLPIEAVSNILRGSALREKVEKELFSDYAGGTIQNVSWKHNSAGIVESMTAHVGAEEGTQFATKEMAEAWMKQVALKGKPVQLEQGGFLVEIERKAGTEISAEVVAHSKKTGMFRAIMYQPSETIDEATQLLSRAAEMSMTKVHNTFRDVWNKGIKPMSGKDRVQVEEVLQAVQRTDNPRWLEPLEFMDEFQRIHGVYPKNKQVLGYYTVKQLEDASYRLINRSLYKTKLDEGFGQVSYLGKNQYLPSSFPGRVVEAGDLKKGALIYDEAVNWTRMLDSPAKAGLTREGLENKLKDSVLVRLDENMEVGIDGMANYAIIPKVDFKIGALSPQQIGYLGGGRIKYDYNWIVHATRNRTYKQFGDMNVELNPVGLFGGITRAETKKFAEKLNKARQIALSHSKGTITKAEANTLLHAVELPRFQSIESVSAFLKKRGVQLDDNIVWNADGVVPTSTGGMRVLSEGERIRAGIKNRVAKARTENRLEDVRGGYGIVSPLEAMARSAGIASRHAAFADYRQHALTMFSNTYGRYMKSTPNSGASPIEVLESGISDAFKAKLDSATKAEIFAHREQIMHTLRTQSWATQQWSGAADNMSDFFISGGKLPANRNQQIADWLANKRNTDPVSAWKNIAFQARMGIFALPQFVLQASMAPSIMAMSPKYGAAAIMDVIPTRIALMAKDPAMLKVLAERMNKARVWNRQETAEFVETVEVIKNLGIIDFGASLPELAGATTGSVASTKLNNALEAGQVFFRLGESIPRITAAGIAARSIRAKGVKLSSDEGKSMMITEVNRLTLGITGADVQHFARGLTSLPTQFWSFPFRMMTALTGKSLSASEKAGMYGSFALLWGAGGIPMGNTIVDYYQTKWGTKLTQEEAMMAYNGLVDTMIFHGTDGEIKSDLSQRMLGSFLPSVIDSFIKNPTMTFLAGPTGGSIVDGYEVAKRELAPIVAAGTGTLDQVTDVALGFLAANITSVDRLYRGMMAYETGVLRGRKGKRAFQASGTELLMWAGGIPLAEMTDMYTMGDNIQDLITDPYRQHALEMYNLTRKQFSDPDNADIYNQQIIAIRLIAENQGILQETLSSYSGLMAEKEFSEEQHKRYEKYRLLRKNIPTLPSSNEEE